METVTKRWIKIIGDHPHAGEIGYIEFIDGKTTVQKSAAWREGAYTVHVVDCPLFQPTALVEKQNMKLIRDPSDDTHQGSPRAGSPRGRRT